MSDSLTGVGVDSFDWPGFPKDETENELRITEVAMREGSDGFPESESAVMSTTENEIVGRVRRFYVSVLAVLSNQFIKLGEEAAGIRLFLERFDLRQMPLLLKSRVEKEFTDASVRMNYLSLQAKTAEQDLQLFKRKHGLEREPSYSERWRNIWGPSIVSVLFLLEVALNSALVSNVVEGLISGIAIATTVAVLNVFLSFIVGLYPLKELNARQTLGRKVMFAVLMSFYALIIIYLNLVFGIFRSIALSAKNIGSWEDLQTWETVNALKPWISLSQVNDVPSLFVVGIGICFAIIALIDGYFYDDPYPGYGRVHRKFVSASKQLEESMKDLTGKVLKIIDESYEVMESHLGQFEDKLTRWGKIENTVRQQFSRYTVWMNQLEQDANKFLSDYRGANIKGRHSSYRSYSTKRPPQYFESKWAFSEQEKDPSRTFSHLDYLINSDKSVIEQKFHQIQQEMVSIRDESYQSLRRFLQKIQDGYDKKE